MRRRRLRGRLGLLGVIAAAAAALVIVVAVLQLTGVTGGSDSDSSKGPNARPGDAGQTFPKGTGVTKTLRQLAARLPLQSEVSQLFLVGFAGFDPNAPFLADLQVRDWGGAVLTRANYMNAQQLTGLAGAVTSTAASVGHVPPLVVADQSGGRGTAFPDLPPPSQPSIGATGKAGVARRDAKVAGATLRTLGVNAVFGPQADLSVPGGPSVNHSFGPDPATVGKLTRAAIEGWASARVAAIVGHFPGQGSASSDPDIGPATVGGSLADLEKRDIVPFARIAHQAAAILVSNAQYTAYDGVSPAVLWPEAIGGVLRTKLGFNGVVVCGDIGATAHVMGESIGRAAVDALRSGCDLLYIQGDAAAEEAAFQAVLASARRGSLPRIGIQASLYRILELKAHYGLIAPAGTH